MAVRAPKARVSRRRRRRGGRVWGGGVPSPLEEGSGKGAVPLSRFFFSFWSSKSLVLLNFECFFVSSSTTDGLLWDDLSGLIAQGNRENPQDHNLTAVAVYTAR